MKSAKKFTKFLRSFFAEMGAFWLILACFLLYEKNKNRQKRTLKALKYKGLRVLKSGGRYRT